MYQFIVLGLGFLLLFGGGYLIKKSDSNGVLQGTLSTQEAATTSAASAVENTVPALGISGVYYCDNDSKCPDPRTLTISNDGGLTLSTTFDNGVEVLDETGTWKEDDDGIVTLIINGTNSELYGTPRIVVLKQISPSTLVAGNGTTYKDWGSPIFRKQKQDLE